MVDLMIEKSSSSSESEVISEVLSSQSVAEKQFCMSDCKVGDVLISSQGVSLIYKGRKDDELFPHVIMYPNGAYGDRTEDGFMRVDDRRSTDCNVLGLAEKDNSLSLQVLKENA